MNSKKFGNRIKLLKDFCNNNNYILGTELLYGRYGDNNISVTEMLSIIIDPIFEMIKNKYPDKLEKACNRGTMVHSMLENVPFNNKKKDISLSVNEYLKSEFSENNINMLKSYIRVYKQWKILYNIEILETEKTYYKDGLRGTIDAIVSPGIVVDYKTSLIDNKKYYLQIAAYCYLSGIDTGYILYMSNKEFKYINIPDIEYHIEIFKGLIEYSKDILNYNIK